MFPILLIALYIEYVIESIWLSLISVSIIVVIYCLSVEIAILKNDLVENSLMVVLKRFHK